MNRAYNISVYKCVIILWDPVGQETQLYASNQHISEHDESSSVEEDDEMISDLYFTQNQDIHQVF